MMRMKNKEKFHKTLLHIALICGIVILAAGILDWFNPYMNFTGQIRPFEMVQVGALLVLALTVRKQNSGNNGNNRSNHSIRGRKVH